MSVFDEFFDISGALCMLRQNSRSILLAVCVWLGSLLPPMQMLANPSVNQGQCPPKGSSRWPPAGRYRFLYMQSSVARLAGVPASVFLSCVRSPPFAGARVFHMIHRPFVTKWTAPSKMG